MRTACGLYDFGAPVQTPTEYRLSVLVPSAAAWYVETLARSLTPPSSAR
ncbi:hypothetical protein WDL1CHR_03923 [Variovorax sp. WDL1]|nr:hypothetical protein CHC07_01094 [Variovorax sp. B4]PNG60842.1 hypothetical protein CHC06_00741 [Variovorax sp. B2]VTV13238.1 hypothetical protein WDL1CHR_03923 [Variovorax sp. WDL1]